MNFREFARKVLDKDAWMRTAPVPEGRPAATRGGDLSRFPLGRGSLVPRELFEREPLALAAADDAGTVHVDPDVALEQRRVATVVMTALADRVSRRCHARVFLAHFKPPTRGTVTPQVSAVSGRKSSHSEALERTGS